MLGISGLPLRLLLAGGAAVAVLGLAGGLYVKARHDEAVKWRARVEAAQKQQKVEAVATQAVDRYHEQTIVIREKADRSVQAVQAAQGGEAPVPPEVLDAWRKGLGGE